MTKPITSRPLKKVGRKPTKPPADAHETVTELAADGWSIVGISHCMGVDPKTFNRWLEDDPSLRNAMELGREQEHHVLYNVLMRKAVEDGNVTAALSILNARHGWRSDQSAQGGAVSVSISLPGPMTMEQFNEMKRATING